jgi:hypothetical protein
MGGTHEYDSVEEHVTALVSSGFSPQCYVVPAMNHKDILLRLILIFSTSNSNMTFPEWIHTNVGCHITRTNDVTIKSWYEECLVFKSENDYLSFLLVWETS